MIRRRFKFFMPARNEFSSTGEETLLSVSEYYGVKPRSEAFDEDAAEGRAETLEGYRKVKAGDFVMNYMLAWKGAYGVSDYDGIVSPAYAVYKIDPTLADRRFIHHRLRSEHMRSVFRARSKGIIESRLRLYPDAFLSMELELPDLDTQKAIADFLDRETARIDQLIEKRSRFADLILERRAVAIAETVVGSSSNNGTWLASLPEGWKAERAKIHFRESQKRSETGEEELLTVSHITGVTKRSEKDVNMFMAESNEGYKLVAPDDVVINTMWAWMGAMGVSSEFGLISPSYGIYTPISKELRPAFVDVMVRSKPFVAEATRRSKGIHSSRLRLYPDAFLDMRLPIPPIELQDALIREVSERVQREDKLLRKNERADALLREFRAALITAAVTGQIDVATWGRQGQTDRRLDQIEEEMSPREARV